MSTEATYKNGIVVKDKDYYSRDGKFIKTELYKNGEVIKVLDSEDRARRYDY